MLLTISMLVHLIFCGSLLYYCYYENSTTASASVVNVMFQLSFDRQDTAIKMKLTGLKSPYWPIIALLRPLFPAFSI